MNRFFGKTSQKLCVAGFVACVAIAPVFQITAVQDLILSDVAIALVGRSLIELERWRNFVAAFSALLVIAALIVFGFLYCLATSARLSGYFRGAAQDLKDFFHNKEVFNGRNGRILIAIFAIAFIGYFALIRSGAGYGDDLYRQISGSFGWMPGFGRVVTEVLNLAIHGAYLIHDRSPLGQIIAMGFLSAAALVMAQVFSGLQQRGGGIAKVKWLNVAASMIIVFNPYFLNGIDYKYDSPGMAAAILLPLVPFLFLGAPRLYTVSSLLCALGTYMSYQSAGGIYIIMVIFAALLKYITEEWSLKEAARFCAKSAVLFVAASAVFLLIARFLGAAGSYRSTGLSVASAPRNIVAYFSSILRDFNGLWKALCVLVAASAAVAVCRLSKKKLRVALPLFAIALALATVLSQGSYIFLSSYFGLPRGKYSFGALLAILASVSVLDVPSFGTWWKRALAAAPAVLLAWSFFSYASAFGNAHANQMQMVRQYLDRVSNDVNELFLNEEWHELSVAFDGNPPWSGEVVNLIKKYPITTSLVGRGGNWLSFCLSYFDPTIAKASIAVGAGPAGQPSWQPIGETTLLLERRYYNILLEDDTGRVIVECKISD